MRPKRPSGNGWEKVGGDAHWTKVEPGYWFESWLHPGQGLFAISAVEVCVEPDLMLPNSVIYQLSVSVLGERCDDGEARSALADFDLLPANEATYRSTARVRRFTHKIS